VCVDDVAGNIWQALLGELLLEVGVALGLDQALAGGSLRTSDRIEIGAWCLHDVPSGPLLMQTRGLGS
jgi:hypothetical protein